MGLFSGIFKALGLVDEPPDYPGPSAAETELLGVQTDYYRQMLEQSQATRTMLEEYLNREPTEFETAAERTGMLAMERYERGLKGELPLPEKFEAQQEEAVGMLEERLSRQGAAPGSTPYIQAMAEHERTWGERADLLKRGEISAAYGPMFGQQQLGMQQQQAGYGQLYGMGGYGAGLMGGGMGLLGYYGGERQGQYGAQFNQSMMYNQLMGSLIGGAGQAAGGYLAGSAIAASDKKLKKNITYLKPIKCERGLIWPCVFQYIWDTVQWHVGVVAQDLQKVYPEFVKQTQGYLAVDYGALSQKLMGEK